MGAFKDLLFEYQDQEPSSLELLAERLGGDVDGDFILCPSPGGSQLDRSCKVRVSSANPSSIFVYYCDGPVGRAYAHIRKLLGNVGSRSDYETSQFARKILEETLAGPATLVERYLRSRGLTLPVPDVLKFHPSLKHPSGGTWPAMVAAVASLNGGISSIHRTFLSRNGFSKAPVDPPKMTLGRVGGCAIRLCAVRPKLVIAEGIETALSVMQETGLGAWAALSAVGLCTIRLPAEVRHVIIAADGEEVGRKAALVAARRLRAQGRIATIAYAPDGKDFNDILMDASRDE